MYAGVDILEDDEKEDLDEDVDDEESKDALAGEDGSIEEVSEIQAVAYRPPPNRRFNAFSSLSCTKL